MLYNFQKQAGFTLIELLVVIAIIGILSAVVLTSLNDARNSAKDAAVIQAVRNLGTTIELIAVDKGDYAFRLVGTTPSNNARWIKSDNFGNNSCINSLGLYGVISDEERAQLIELCEYIVDNLDDTVSFWPSTHANYRYALFLGTNGGNPSIDMERTWSVMVKLNSGEMFCLGSSGRNYRGAVVPSWTSQPGCYSNP